MYLFFVLVATFHISSFSVVDAQNSLPLYCNTPNGTAGSCINIRQCIPLLVQLQERPIRPETIDFLKKSHCGFEDRDPRACCPAGSDPISVTPMFVTSTEVPSSTLENVVNDDPMFGLLDNPSLPSECGRRFKPGDVEHGKLPWLALLEYDDGRQKTLFCHGVLITKRYVLTAAHCLFNLQFGILLNVRLGEYNLSSARDCVKLNNVVKCFDYSITVRIEERISHELYEPTSNNYIYNIGLLRLSRDIVSTNYVSSICLPNSEPLDSQLYVIDWGNTGLNSSSNITMKPSLPLTNIDNCSKRYHKFNITLGYGQICVSGKRRKNSCGGGSGGPLMTREITSTGAELWTTVGIESFGPPVCGRRNFPYVYTKVYDFIPWIISNIKP